MNESKAAGYFDEAKGKLKQAAGETFNNQSLADSGTADQVKGHAEQAWGSVKDTVHDLGRHVVDGAPATPFNPSDPSYSSDPVYTEDRIDAAREEHKVRSGIAGAAENVKDAIQSGLEHLEHAIKH